MKKSCCEPIVNVTKVNHGGWLQYRRTGIGGSDSSTIVGLNPYNSPYRLYLDKTGELPETPDNEAMRQGRDFEAYVADRWMEATSKRVRRNNTMWRSRTWPWMLADIDREVVGENAGLECKTTTLLNKSDLAHGEIPQTYYVQCQHYMAVMGFDRMYLAVLVLSRGFYHFTIERNEAEITALAEAEHDFWHHVMHNEPPEVDGSDATLEAIRAKYGQENTALPVLELSRTCGSDLASLTRIQADIKALKDSEQAIKARVMQAMGDYPVASVGDYNVTWKTVNRPSCDFKTLQTAYPQAYAACVKINGSRQFRFRKAKAAQ